MGTSSASLLLAFLTSGVEDVLTDKERSISYDAAINHKREADLALLHGDWVLEHTTALAKGVTLQDRVQHIYMTLCILNEVQFVPINNITSSELVNTLLYSRLVPKHLAFYKQELWDSKDTEEYTHVCDYMKKSLFI